MTQRTFQLTVKRLSEMRALATAAISPAQQGNQTFLYLIHEYCSDPSVGDLRDRFLRFSLEKRTRLAVVPHHAERRGDGVDHYISGSFVSQPEGPRGLESNDPAG